MQDAVKRHLNWFTIHDKRKDVRCGMMGKIYHLISFLEDVLSLLKSFWNNESDKTRFE